MKRWDYFKGHINYLFDGGHHNLWRLSLIADEHILEDLNNSSLDLAKLRKKGWLEIQDISEWERIFLHDKNGIIPESLHYRNLFENGEDSAIIDFCRNNDTALRSSWVIEQIEKWKKENTSKSKQKLKELFKAFTDSRGKSTTEKNIEFLREDKKICDDMQKLLDSDLSLNLALDKIAKQKNKSCEVVKDIYYGYLEKGTKNNNVLSDENLIALRETLIRVKFMPAEGESYPFFIDEAIDQLFLNTEEFGKEYELYKEMRFAYQGVIFDERQPMLRKKQGNSLKNNLDLIINNLSKDKGMIKANLQEIYKTFREMEIRRNEDNSIGDSWEAPEEIIGRELLKK